MRRLAAFVVTGAAAVALSAPAASSAMVNGMGMGGQAAAVTVESDAYAPGRISVLAGDSVSWTVASRFHTVSADDGSWTSARLFAGDSYSRQFMAAGVVTYYCMVHSFMHGEVDVYNLLLDSAPAPAAPNKPYPLRGRAAFPEGTTVTVEGDTGAGFQPVGSAVVGPDGTFGTTVMPTTTTTYQAVSGTSTSPPVLLRVVDRTVLISDVRRGRRDIVSVRVTPASPGATVLLQLNLRERFGWWPQAQTRLDRSSRARFVVALGRRVPARVALTLPDGATQLALSRTLRIGR